jgi:hypothetical protein
MYSMVRDDEVPRFVTPVDKEFPTKDVEKACEDATISNETAACKNPFIL